MFFDLVKQVVVGRVEEGGDMGREGRRKGEGRGG